jgi:hypothetical protein
VTGVQRLGILSNPSQFAQSKASGPEVLKKKKKLRIPVNMLGARKKTSEILTNQKAAKYGQRIFSHSNCSKQSSPQRIVSLTCNTINIRGQVPD